MPPETATATLDEQLTALLEGDFLLTDARGGVSRFGARASALFGWHSEEILGRHALESLTVPGTADSLRERLKTSDDPPTGIFRGRARHLDGQEFDVEWLVVPVWLRNSLELSRMLEVVGTEGAPETKLMRLERDHFAALAAVRAAAAGATAETEDRLAGFVLAFRALGEHPWADAALERPPAEPEPAAAVVGPNEEQQLRVGKLEQEVETLHSELAELRAAIGQAQAAGAAAAAEAVATVRDEIAAARATVDQALAAREDATAARATADQALALAEETRMDAECWRHELAERARSERAEADAKPARPLQAREGRPGFDDVEQPLAVISLDGRFEQLNPAFCGLVGYTESEFRRARWPSSADRDNLIEHRRLQAGLAAGELEHARIETVYLHGQGLIVPVHGTLELIREDGRPSRLLLSAEG